MGRRGGGGGRIPTAYAIYSEPCRAGLGWLREGGGRAGDAGAESCWVWKDGGGKLYWRCGLGGREGRRDIPMLISGAVERGARGFAVA